MERLPGEELVDVRRHPVGSPPDPAPREPVDPDLPPGGRRRGRTGLRWRILAAVAAGGAIGAALRYEVGLLVTSPRTGFPLATFLTNVSGGFLLAVLVTLAVERWPPTTYVRPFLATGILGAYTTWSTFMVQDDELVRAGHLLGAAGYVAASLAAGLAAAYGGILLARRAWGRRRREGRRW